MCGLCGELRLDWRPADAAAVERMTAALAARGPDGLGVFQERAVALGHPQQPMVDRRLGLVAVSNGAIYNEHELRADLSIRGYDFVASGGTEVLLKSFHAWGPNFVTRLDGMFAFAIWERASGRLILGRDRQGIKPLYISRGPALLRFASTLPALLRGASDETRDLLSLHQSMSLDPVVSASRAELEGVRGLPPAGVLTVEPDGRETWRRQPLTSP